MLPAVKDEQIIGGWPQATASGKLGGNPDLCYSKCFLKELVVNFNTLRGWREYKESREGRQKEMSLVNPSPSPQLHIHLHGGDTERIADLKKMKVGTQVPTQFTTSMALGKKELYDNVLIEVCFIRQAGY